MFSDALSALLATSGFSSFTWQNGVMLLISFVLIYLAIVRKFEPLLLLPIAFGMLLANLPITGLMDHPTDSAAGGLLYYLYQGVKLGIYPSLIFLGIGAMTDFGPLIAQPTSLSSAPAHSSASQWRLFFRTCLGFCRMKPLPSPSSVVRTARPLSS